MKSSKPQYNRATDNRQSLYCFGGFFIRESRTHPTHAVRVQRPTEEEPQRRGEATPIEEGEASVCDEPWIYVYDPTTKQQSTVWVFQDEPTPTKVIRTESTLKQMVAYFVGQKIELMGHPPYSPDLATKDLFPSVKNKLCGQRFRAVKKLLMRSKCCVRPLSTFYSNVSTDGVEERSLVSRSRSFRALARTLGSGGTR
ncbi:hypothetical protein EVAR_96277_1 [Eumeta japonica]|uniref:Histone-lysine N-methyltransferase SETMAR n=1 Tax=Eumeta variegata TaxID=151549 RepID=A0A4C1WJW0_EUMVA|nr:hypothetical protein EVAR_96277_1 [Eumeta japonica]